MNTQQTDLKETLRLLKEHNQRIRQEQKERENDRAYNIILNKEGIKKI
jgi:hypothetical protein